MTHLFLDTSQKSCFPLAFLSAWRGRHLHYLPWSKRLLICLNSQNIQKVFVLLIRDQIISKLLNHMVFLILLLLNLLNLSSYTLLLFLGCVDLFFLCVSLACLFLDHQFEFTFVVLQEFPGFVDFVLLHGDVFLEANVFFFLLVDVNLAHENLSGKLEEFLGVFLEFVLF